MKAKPPVSAYILLLDDEKDLLYTIKEQMEAAAGHHVTAVSSVMRAEEAMSNGQFDLAVLDVCLPDGNGLELLQKFKAQAPNMGVILITGYAEIDTATQALRYGADDFLGKPCLVDDILLAVDKILKKKAQKSSLQNKAIGHQYFDASDVFVGKSSEIKRLQHSLPRFAQASANIFITGEQGTGKSLFASVLHGLSEHAKQLPVQVECKAFSQDFTAKMLKNKLVILKDVDALSESAQHQLSVLIQDEHLNVRLISTTVEQYVQLDAGLMHALQGISLHLPRLAERRDDIPLLAEHFLLQLGEEQGVTLALTDEAKVRLQSYGWPGHVAELRSALQQAALSQQNGRIQAEDLPAHLEQVADHFIKNNSIDIGKYETFNLKATLETLETQVLCAALDRFDWNQFHTAKFLQMNRTTLIEKIKKRGLKRKNNP